jgi:DNA-binding beta-propeller fold protein YncE
VIDLVNATPLTTIPIANPNYLAVTPDGNDVYVSSQTPEQVTRIDTSTDAVVGTPIALPSNGRGIAITPDGARAYVAGDDGVVREIDLDTQTLTATTFAVSGPRPRSRSRPTGAASSSPTPAATCR